MYVIRDLMQCKPGKVRDMVNRFKSLNKLSSKMGMKPSRIMTDVTGEHYWTVVTVTEVENIEEHFALMEKAFHNEEAGRIMEGYHDHVVSGRREIYKIEE